MHTGKIAKLTDNGFGFISREGEAENLFFHLSGLVEGLNYEDLREGDTVEFEIGEGRKGPNAVNVTRVASEA